MNNKNCRKKSMLHDYRDGPGRSSAPAMKKDFERLVQYIGQVVLGKEEQIRLALTCFFARGHLLIEDIPGKTTVDPRAVIKHRKKNRQLRVIECLCSTPLQQSLSPRAFFYGRRRGS
jgi:hypothetical protein